MVGGEIKVVMTMDNNDFTIKTVKAGQTLSEMKKNLETTAVATKNLNEHFDSLGSRFRQVSLNIFLAKNLIRDFQEVFLALPMSIIKASAEVEKLTVLMSGLSKETEETKRHAEGIANTKFVFDLSTQTPFNVKSLGDAFIKLKVGGIDPTNGSLKALADSVARFGGNSDNLKYAALAIQQMGGKGVISMEELRRQLGEAIPDAIQVMAQAVGKSVMELDKLVSKGMVATKGNLDRFFTLLQLKNDGASAALMDTWGGMTARLETKWMLFRNKIGEGGMFDAAKQGLQEFIDSFDGVAARNLAFSLGSVLNTMVQGLSSAVHLAVEYGTALKVALVVLAAMRIEGKFGDAIRGAPKSLGQAFSGTEEGSGAKWLMENRRAQATAMADQIKFNNEKIAANDVALNKELRQVQAAELQKMRTLRDSSAAAANAKIVELNAALRNVAIQEQKQAQTKQSYAAEVAKAEALFLREGVAASADASAKKIAIVKSEATALEAIRSKAYRDNLTLDGTMNTPGFLRSKLEDKARAERKIENTALMSEMTSRIMLEKQEQQAILMTAAALEKEAAAAVATADAHRLSRAQMIASLSTTTANTAAIGAVNASLGNSNKLLADKAAKLVSVTTLTRLFGGALSGLGTVFTALGGWVTVAISALFILGTKLYEFVNRWERVKEIVDQIKKGMAPDPDAMADLVKRNKEAQKAVEDAEAKIGRKKGSAENAYGIAHGETNAKDMQALIEARQRADTTRKALAEGTLLVIEQTAGDEAAAAMRAMDRKVADIHRAADAESQALESAHAKKVKALGDKPESEADAEAYKKEQNAIRRRQANSAMTLAAAAADAALVAQSDGLLNRSVTPQSMANAQKLVDATQKRLTEAREMKERADDLGTINLAKAKSTGHAHVEREDPLTRAAEKALSDLEQAKLTLANLEKETKTFEDYKRTALTKVIGQMVHGDFDTKSVGADGKTTGTNFLGDMKNRSSLFKKLITDLGDGKTTVDQFTSSMTGLTAIERAHINAMIESEAKTLAIKDAEKAISDARLASASATSDLVSAQEAYATQTNKTTDTEKLAKHFEQVRLKTMGAAEGLKEFTDNVTKALAASALTAAFKFGSMADDTNAKAELTLNTDGKQARAAAELRLELQQISREYEKVAKNLTQYSKDSPEFINGAAAAEAGRLAAIRLANAKATVASRTEMDNLRIEWANTTDQMNKDSAKWANDTVKMIGEFVEKGKFDFKGMLKSWLADLLQLKLKQTLGKEITGAFDGLADYLKGTVIKGDTSSGTAGQIASQAAADGKITDVMTKFQTGFTTVFSKVETGFGSIVDTLGGGLMQMLSGLWNVVVSMATATGGAASSAWSGVASFAASFFADGGIMTDRGRLPLHKYAMGGIANSPQVAIFGEGRMPEANVPLPDGRTIPVTMSGPMAASAPPSVTFNVINQTSTAVTAKQGESRFDGKKMILDVVLQAMNEPGPFRSGMKGA